MRFRTKAWIGLVAYVVAVEKAAPKDELLSNAFDDWLKKLVTGLPATAVTLTVAGHLLNVIPEKYDWLHQLGVLLTRGDAPGLRAGSSDTVETQAIKENA